MPVARIIENSIREFGRFQLYVFLMGFLVNLPLALQELSITILAPPLEFVCSDPNIADCSSKCPSHEFDKSIFQRTIIEEWDLVCDREWLQHMSQTILMAGIFVGNFLFGFLSDKYGRRKPLIIAIFCEIVTGLLIAFSTHLWMFLLLRFLVAVAAGGSLVVGFVLVFEVIGHSSRSTYGILFQMTYYIGHSLLGLIGYLIRDWRYIQLTISSPVILLITYYWILPESPRWLLTMRRLEEAIEMLEKAAIVNKMPPENVRSHVMSKLENTNKPNETIIDLMKHKYVRMITICIYINWAVVGLTFFGVAQFIGQIGGNLFINISAAGLIQIPGNIVIIILIKTVGRKITLLSTYTLCAVACLSITFVPTEPAWIKTLLGCLSMMGISLCFAVVFVWSGELFPTIVRNVGMGSSATCAKFGSMIAPFIINMGSEHPWVPPLIFGIAPILGFVISLILPETINVRMPDTVEEAEYLGRTGRLGSVISLLG